MKKIKTIKTNNFVKKIFVKICRILGYELIDQNNFEIPTLEKNALENISIAGKKSISIPLGQIDITRKVKSLNVYFRSCSKVNLWNQNKERIFEADKDEYALRSLYSILKSINYSKKSFNEINIKLSIIDDNSSDEFIQDMKKLLSKFDIDNEIISLQKNEVTQDVKDSNFASIKKCYTLAKENSEDLIYFVEDDYIHDEICILEMIGAYERIATQLNKEILLCPTDYPYLYASCDPTYIFLGNKKHWRKTEQSLGTFLISKINLNIYWENLLQFASGKDDPAELALHKIYEKEPCFSPIPSLAIHCANINSIYGISPNINWQEIWDDNKII
ncbi:MAG: glycosyltransferase family 2 protein [Pelagibacterales bacterium]|nr:glycosyltransferase family 2 protein [Pelagibacterales bacterium]